MANPLTTTARALLAAAWRPLEWQFGGDESRNGPHMPWAVVMPTDEGEWVVLEMNTHRIGYSFSARLIAAAPTLLDQLCERVEALEAALAPLVAMSNLEVNRVLEHAGAGISRAGADVETRDLPALDRFTHAVAALRKAVGP